MLAGTLYEQYPKLTILNPLDNGEFMLGDDEENIINHDLELLARCDVLLLAPGWEDSKGCNKELNKALDKGMDILKIEDDGEDVTLSVFRQATLTFNGQTMRTKWEKVAADAVDALRADKDVQIVAVNIFGQKLNGPGALGFVKAQGKTDDILAKTQMIVTAMTENVVEGIAEEKGAKEELCKILNIHLDNEIDIKAFTANLLRVFADDYLERITAETAGKSHDVH